MLGKNEDIRSPEAAQPARSKPRSRSSSLSKAPNATGYTIKNVQTGKEHQLSQIADGFLDGRSLIKAGLRVYDPGYRATAVIKSSMTHIDGHNGVLRYRGYPIDQLVNLSFLEVIYLLNHSELPKADELQTFTQHIYAHRPEVDTFARNVVRVLGPTASPMMAVATSLAALGAVLAENDPNRLYDPLLYKRDQDAANSMLEQALAAVPSVYLHVLDSLLPGLSTGAPVDSTFDTNQGYAENFARKLRLDERCGLPLEECAKALNTIWILQADHEVTASTSAVLHAASTLVTPWAAWSVGISTGYGPLHGGAIEIAFAQLVEIGSPANVSAYLDRVKNKEVRLFGFGHRIYRVEDPRSRIIRNLLMHLQELRRALTGEVDPLVEVALALEEAALKDDYFSKRKLAPNADFFGALVYHSIGFPGEFGLVMASIARSAGAGCHWREEMSTGKIAIWRPGQVPELGKLRTDIPQSVFYRPRSRSGSKLYLSTSRL